MMSLSGGWGAGDIVDVNAKIIKGNMLYLVLAYCKRTRWNCLQAP